MALACSTCGSLKPAPTGVGDWRCSYCAVWNRALHLACSVCASVRPAADSWLCLRCQTHSPAEDEQCVECGLAARDNQPGTFTIHIDSDSDEGSSEAEAEDDSDTRTPGDAQDAWHCTAAEVAAATNAVWRCAACSFDNPNVHAPICEICGTLRECGV
mmetsp:Transcript_24175/g.46428  ORF Transcript_24175/g.46428 Transcript_24175/m.46428 type:complete len:158 (-) Transcript_24175:3-476(-)